MISQYIYSNSKLSVSSFYWKCQIVWTLPKTEIWWYSNLRPWASIIVVYSHSRRPDTVFPYLQRERTSGSRMKGTLHHNLHVASQAVCSKTGLPTPIRAIRKLNRPTIEVGLIDVTNVMQHQSSLDLLTFLSVIMNVEVAINYITQSEIADYI